MKKIFKHKKFTAVFTDENGYFSFTGEMGGGSGAIGDEIAKIDSDFEPIAKMHLANCETGEPMHAWENAKFIIESTGADRIKRVMALFRCTADQARAFRDFYGIRTKKWGLPTKYAEFQIEMAEQWKREVGECYEAVNSISSNLTSGFVDPYDENGDPISEEYGACLDGFDEPEKAIAAAMQEDCDVCDVEEDGEFYTVAGRTYRVLTDDEADSAWNDSLDNYIEECVLPEIPGHLQNYFSEELWKEDARHDGRGHSLSSYNGDECEQTVLDTTYYLYRQ